MNNKIDARIIKTKSRLYSAFIEMLNEKLFEEITINEMCNRAGVRRATFYKHFTDKCDFLADMTASLIKKFDATMQNGEYKNYQIEYHVEYVRKLIEHLISERDVLNLLLKSNQMPTLISTIVSVNYEALAERLRLSVVNGERLVASVKTVATMLAGGIGTMIVSWFDGGMQTPKEEFVSEIEKVIRAVFVK